MQKEKSVKSYTRRTKSGKTVVVHAYKAKYDAAEEMRKALAKKEGAGKELANRKKQVEQPMPDNKLGFSAEEFKAWYHWDTESDPKNKAALKVEKALKKSMGAKAYKKFYDDMTDGYSARGHNKAFKGLESSLSSQNKETSTKGQKGEPSKKTGNTDKSTSAKSKSKEENPFARKDVFIHSSKGTTASSELQRQKDYIKAMDKRGYSDSTEGKPYMDEQKRILADMMKGGTPLSHEDIEKSEQAAIKKHKLSYEEDGVYSDAKGRSYRLTTHPITGETKVHPLVGDFTGAWRNKAAQKHAGNMEEYHKAIWGVPMAKDFATQYYKRELMRSRAALRDGKKLSAEERTKHKENVVKFKEALDRYTSEASAPKKRGVAAKDTYEKPTDIKTLQSKGWQLHGRELPSLRSKKTQEAFLVSPDGKKMYRLSAAINPIGRGMIPMWRLNKNAELLDTTTAIRKKFGMKSDEPRTKGKISTSKTQKSRKELAKLQREEENTKIRGAVKIPASLMAIAGTKKAPISEQGFSHDAKGKPLNYIVIKGKYYRVTEKQGDTIDSRDRKRNPNRFF